MVRYAAEEGDALQCLGDEIAELAAHVHAATGRLLQRLAEFDRREGWAAPGFLSCAHWLSWRTGIAPGAAREKVRVARALTNLPLLAAALQRGELSYAKVRAITRVATPENESDLLELARQATAAQVERVVRAWRRVDRLEESAQERARHNSRSLEVHADVDGMVIVRGRLDPEAGALLERALAAATEALYARRPSSGEAEGGDDAAARRADAIGLIAELALRGLDGGARTPMHETTDDGRTNAAADRTDTRRARVVGRADRFLVHVHVDADALRDGSEVGQGMVADSRISAETSRRLSCDAGRVFVTNDSAIGDTLELDRRRRTISPALRRALERRDRGCRFPGCGNRYCDAHHIEHWADGGATTLANTVLLCRSHHRAVHEGGYRIEAGERGELTFVGPDGRLLPEVPPAPILAGRSVERPVAVERTGDPRVGLSGQRLDMDFTLMTLLRKTG